eukprot:364458-Chlamydomonas_euryale.AAC.3
MPKVTVKAAHILHAFPRPRDSHTFHPQTARSSREHEDRNEDHSDTIPHPSLSNTSHTSRRLVCGEEHDDGDEDRRRAEDRERQPEVRCRADPRRDLLPHEHAGARRDGDERRNKRALADREEVSQQRVDQREHAAD